MCLFCNRDVNALNWVPRNWLQNSSDMPWIMPWLQNSLSTQFHQHLLDHCSWVPRPFSGRRDALSWSIRCMLGGRSSVMYNIYIILYTLYTLYIYNIYIIYIIYIYILYYNIYIYIYILYIYILYIIPNISYMLYVSKSCNTSGPLDYTFLRLGYIDLSFGLIEVTWTYLLDLHIHHISTLTMSWHPFPPKIADSQGQTVSYFKLGWYVDSYPVHIPLISYEYPINQELV